MKKSLLPLAFAVMLFACNSGENIDSLQDTNISSESTTWSHYGEAIPDSSEKVPVQNVAQMISETGSAVGLFEAEIVQSCQTMGCWMTVKGPNQDTVRVFMKDHAFFVPKDSVQGKQSFFYGEAFYDTISVDFQKHLLEDAGATAEEIEAVSEPAFELTFEAAGVMIADVPPGAPMAGDE